MFKWFCNKPIFSTVIIIGNERKKKKILEYKITVRDSTDVLFQTKTRRREFLINRNRHRYA